MDASIGNGTPDPEEYERKRLEFLNHLERGWLLWTPTKQEYDKNVEVARIFRVDPSEQIALMRIRPGGFRSPRSTDAYTKMIFDPLQGLSRFLYKGKRLTPKPGERIVISPKSKYSLRSLETDRPVFLLLQILKVQPRVLAIKNKEPVLAIENVPNDSKLDRATGNRGCDTMWTPLFARPNLSKIKTISSDRRL